MSAPAALITGGTSGIGRATAELLHRRGYRVAVTGRNPVTLAAAERELPEGVLVVRADARSLEDTDHAVEEIRSRFGGLDVVFLNAAVVRRLPIGADAFDLAAYDELFDTNVKGQVLTLHKALPLLRDGGSVVFNVGIGATRGLPGGAAVSAATKGALLSMVPSLALDLASRRIRVNAVSPGPVDTGIWAKQGLTAEALEEVARATVAHVPLGRFGTSEEIAEVVAFLASGAAGFITGENIVVGGGVGV